MVRRIVACALIILGTAGVCRAEGQPAIPSFPFNGEIKTDGANVRIDSRITGEIICTLNRGEPVEVVGQLYDWYKIRLPEQAPSYDKKTLVAPVDDKTVKVLRSNVNVRLRPEETAPILGKVNEDEILHVAESRGEWFRIQPVPKSYGWINTKLVLPFRTGLKPEKKAEPPQPAPIALVPGSQVILEGTVEPYGKVLKRAGTHKLIVTSPDGASATYLLKGEPANLNALNYRKVRVTGVLMEDKRQKYPVVEVAKLDLLE